MKWKLIGDVMVLKKDVPNLEELLSFPGVKTVVKLGSINGFKREPQIDILAGDSTETIHKENKCLFKLDIAKVMWSKGNSTERMRIANIVEDGEVIVDMFAGIGYFSVPIAIHSKPSKIYSIEINPVSYGYLCENIKLNKIEDIINPILGNCKDSAPINIADRVLMGYIGDTHHYLDTALKSLKKGGIIHYHESVPEKIKFKRPIKRINEAAGDLDVQIINKRVIKKYSPGVCHVVIDAKINNGMVR